MLVDVQIDFKDGYTNYHAGERVWLEDDEAEKFLGYGWVTAPGVKVVLPPQGQNTTLNIHDGQLGHTSEY